ncbi:Cytochrome c [Cohaesibacter sp. ES.047]|uniref:c-type cytochrome n=1 Tax=Cohaesibacter sp. ES.047 TaxID=1798205 RepID=UPI000BB90E67|nr:cytochrome c [Cohaesibacter sp. ES.047]SNY90367.1 Cytochrome c [Cohaesibacter sp. ES.047]
MVRRRKRWKFARSRNSFLILFLSVSSLLLLIFSGGDISQIGGHNADGPILKQGLDGDQIRRTGLSLYNANCMSCHGIEGRGTSFAPPLVHPLYMPDKLSDRAFVKAIFQGVEQTNWKYGPMKPVKALNQVESAQILAYIRSLQKVPKFR